MRVLTGYYPECYWMLPPNATPNATPRLCGRPYFAREGLPHSSCSFCARKLGGGLPPRCGPSRFESGRVGLGRYTITDDNKTTALALARPLPAGHDPLKLLFLSVITHAGSARFWWPGWRQSRHERRIKARGRRANYKGNRRITIARRQKGPCWTSDHS